MKNIIYEDPDQCRLVWEKLWPVKGLFDLWQVRSCFQEEFSRPLRFHVVEENKKAVGFLALCWNEEEKQYVQFPGETWNKKTWIEQNRVVAASPEVLNNLLDSLSGQLNLRYLAWNPLLDFMGLIKQDELDYIFSPWIYDFNFEKYCLSFSGRSRKKLKSEMKKLEALKVSYRFNQKQDIEKMFQMNIDAFGDKSYFSDPRFYRSFENLATCLESMGMLRITTILVGNTIAAVDMGAIWKNSYTLLTGGTNPDFPGIAKLINLHHLKWSCNMRFDVVDFLCGDFNWKERFHLTPRPLFEFSLEKLSAGHGRDVHGPESACA